MKIWKKTKDKLPKEGEIVLLMTLYHYIFLGTWSEYRKKWMCDTFTPTPIIYDQYEIIAWCPIPKYDLNDLKQ